MLGWLDDIERITTGNDDFRRVVFTGEHAQLVVMSLRPGEDIGWESHGHLDQFIRIEVGRALVDLGTNEDNVDESYEVGADWAFIVPAGTWHNVTNAGDETVKLYTIYSPPEHPDGTVHATKAEAEAAEHH
jgi:mannose-6-phosphate isomerase-like protein (cupin superfamily)